MWISHFRCRLSNIGHPQTRRSESVVEISSVPGCLSACACVCGRLCSVHVTAVSKYTCVCVCVCVVSGWMCLRDKERREEKREGEIVLICDSLVECMFDREVWRAGRYCWKRNEAEQKCRRKENTSAWQRRLERRGPGGVLVVQESPEVSDGGGLID